jgi:chromosome segregation ATPase
LDHTLRELSESKNDSSESILQSQAEILEQEIETNRILHNELSRVTDSSTLAIEDLTKKASQLSHQLSREREDAGYKLDQSRAEVKTLGSRLAECEAHIQQLASIAQDATRPIVRQLESIQIQHGTTLKNWEALEDTWNARFQSLAHENSELVARKTAFDDRMREMVYRVGFN